MEQNSQQSYCHLVTNLHTVGREWLLLQRHHLQNQLSNSLDTVGTTKQSNQLYKKTSH